MTLRELVNEFAPRLLAARSDTEANQIGEELIDAAHEWEPSEEDLRTLQGLAPPIRSSGAAAIVMAFVQAGEAELADEAEAIVDEIDDEEEELASFGDEES